MLLRRLVCAAVVALFGMFAGAGADAQAPAGAQAGQKFYAVGCLTLDPASSSTSTVPPYIITDSRGEEPVVYRIAGDDETLKFHVGHTVEVSGPLSAPPATASGPHAKALLMRVQSVVYVSPSCSLKK